MPCPRVDTATATNQFRVGTLASPVNILLRRPGTESKWRVAIEEWERLPGDPEDLAKPTPRPLPPVWEQRLIYADYVGL